MNHNKKWLYSNLGNYFKLARTKASISQTEAADMLGYSGPQYISNIERGACAVGHDLVRKFIKVYKMNKTQVIEDVLKIQLQYMDAELHGKKLRKTALRA